MVTLQGLLSSEKKPFAARTIADVRYRITCASSKRSQNAFLDHANASNAVIQKKKSYYNTRSPGALPMGNNKHALTPFPCKDS
jgi:hypothetical protein